MPWCSPEWQCPYRKLYLCCIITALSSQIVFLTLRNLSPSDLGFRLQDSLKHLEFREKFSLRDRSALFLCPITVAGFVMSLLIYQKKVGLDAFCLGKQIAACDYHICVLLLLDVDLINCG